jgi:mRNA-degrading endonuclease toxin of MazEF toxin-antitoxin module
LVVSVDAFNRNDLYPKVMVVHLTTVTRAGDPYRWEVEIPRGIAGLPTTSLAKCGEVYTVLKSDLTALAGALPRAYVERVDAALAVSLGLPPRA